MTSECKINLHQRSEAALTHPVTVIALAVLLLNDLVLKFVWQGSWITGKLSDLAWVIFASPLLAFILSFIARENRIAQRSAWIAAYLGLPLLYFAFNTLEPIHNFIISGFSLLSGKAGGSPFDPTDSLVIPLGLAVALSVWRNIEINHPASRLRTGMLVAAIASLSTMATISPPPESGIIAVGIDRNGSIVAKAGGGEYLLAGITSFSSDDGGLTWMNVEYIDDDIDWGDKSVDTPRGFYFIDGTNIVRHLNDDSRIVYSAIRVNEKSDRIAQEAATMHLGMREVSIEPHAIHYDSNSYHLVVAMGLQGVVIGSPDEKWASVGVERFQPIDFSLSSRIKRLNRPLIWLIALGLSITFTGLALMLFVAFKQLNIIPTLWISAITMIVILSIIILVEQSNIDIPFLCLSAIIPLASFIVVIPYALTVNQRIFTGLIISIISLMYIIELIWYYINATSSADFDNIFIMVYLIMMLGGISSIIAARPSYSLLASSVLAMVAMIVLCLLSFFMWMSGSIVIETAKITAILLNAITAIVFGTYLWHRQRSDATSY